MTTYATTADLAAYMTDNGLGAPPANAQQLIDRASRLVTRATMTAVYEVDANGVAVDPVQVAAFKAATLEHVVALIALGSNGAPATQYQSVSAGRISLGRGASTEVAGMIADGDTLAPQAYLALQDAGLAGQEAWVI